MTKLPLMLSAGLADSTAEGAGGELPAASTPHVVTGSMWRTMIAQRALTQIRLTPMTRRMPDTLESSAGLS
jgi:hypothetical protein